VERARKPGFKELVTNPASAELGKDRVLSVWSAAWPEESLTTELACPWVIIGGSIEELARGRKNSVLEE
jgi:hypothetical protein